MSDDMDPDRKRAIARLVSKNKMVHEKPGQYYNDDADPAEIKKVPQYDIAALQTALPEVLQVDLKVTNGVCTAVLEDGKSDEPTRVDFGSTMPATTAELIETIREHYRKEFAFTDDTEAVDAFAALDEIE